MHPIEVRGEFEEKRRDMFEGGKQDGDRGDERGYRPLDCPERDMKEAEEWPVDHHGRGDDD
jgi:hypothetical protein